MPLTATSKRRMLKLAEFLETKVPKKKFDMEWIVRPGIDGGGLLACGSAACAIGWCPSIPSFNRAGFKYGQRGLQVEFKGWVGFQAAREFFQLEKDEDSYLFDDVWRDNERYGETPKQVARRIRQFVAADGRVS